MPDPFTHSSSAPDAGLKVIEVLHADAHGAVVGGVFQAIADSHHVHGSIHGPAHDAHASVVFAHHAAADAAAHGTPAHAVLHDPLVHSAPHPAEAPHHVDSVQQQAHAEERKAAERAHEDQARADRAVAAGDYKAAAHFRETAESHAWHSGGNSMLHGSASVELHSAAEHQHQALHYEHLEAQHIRDGNYEAARSDAAHAEQLTRQADQTALCGDHTTHVHNQHEQLNWAVHEIHSAHEDAAHAHSAAVQGDLHHAAVYAAHAEEHHQAADHHTATAEHSVSATVAPVHLEAHHDPGAGHTHSHH